MTVYSVCTKNKRKVKRHIMKHLENGWLLNKYEKQSLNFKSLAFNFCLFSNAPTICN